VGIGLGCCMSGSGNQGGVFSAGLRCLGSRSRHRHFGLRRACECQAEKHYRRTYHPEYIHAIPTWRLRWILQVETRLVDTACFVCGSKQRNGERNTTENLAGQNYRVERTFCKGVTYSFQPRV
jgi:hypothetical protein